MRTSEEIKDLIQSLVLAKAKFDKIGRDKQAYNYKYAPLEVLIRATEKHLTANDLTIIQFPVSDEHKLGVETILAHGSGQYIGSKFSMPIEKMGPQDIGSALTYYRRYAYLAILGLQPDDEDDDAQEAQTKSANFKPKTDKTNGRNASEKQINLLVKLAKEAGRDEIKAREWASTVTGQAVSDEIKKLMNK